LKSNTLVLLGVFVVLLGLVFLASRPEETTSVEKLHLDGWKVSKDTRVEDAPYDRLEIRHGEVQIHFRRDEDDRDKWHIEKPVKAMAEGYRVRAVVNLFSDDLEALLSQPLKEEAKKSYGFDGEGSISLRLTGKDGDGAEKKIEIVIGRSDRAVDDSESMPTVRTWLMQPGAGTVHLIEGTDFRKALELSLKEFRSKRVLSLGKWSDVDKLVIEDPESTRHKRVVVVRDESAPAPEPKDEEKKEGEEKVEKKPSKPEKWRFEEPAELKLGEPRSLFSSIANLTATEIVAAADAPKDVGLADADKPAIVTVVAGERKAVLKVGKEKDGDAWIKIEGKDGELYKISSYSRKQLVKGADDLREKKILGVSDKEDVEKLEIIAAGRKPVSVEKRSGRWVRAKDGAPADKDEMGRLAGALANFRVSEFAPGKDLAEAGLKKPELRLRFTERGLTRELRFGSEEDSKVYAMLGADGEVVRVSTYTRKQLDKGWSDLQNKKLFELKGDNIEKARITHAGGQSVALELKEKEAGGEKTWVLTAPAESRKVKQSTAKTIATTFGTLKAKEIVTAKKAADVGLKKGQGTTVVATDAGGKRYTLRVADKKEDKDPYAVCEGCLLKGKVFTLASYQAGNLTKKLDDLVE
jgi:hypothetical protein